MAILGELTAEVIHEINNLMGGISGYAQIGLSRQKESDSADSFGKILECVKLASSLTKNLLSFKTPPVSGSPGDIEKAAAMVLDLFRFRTKPEAGIRIIWDPVRPLPNVALPTADLQLVLANLVENALDAVREFPPGLVRLTAEKTGNELTIGVWNSGPAIPEDDIEKVFAPFFTTKLDGSGTGLGLSVARRIIAQAGGEIAATNIESGGVLFSFALRLASPEVQARSSDEAAPPPRLDGRHVLVVDDEETARNVLKLMVSSMGGATVDAAASGHEALGLLQHKTFHAVLVDLIMPGLSGQQLYYSLPRPVQRRVVFVTGDTGSPATKDFLAATGQPALFKPVDLGELLRTLQNVAGA